MRDMEGGEKYSYKITADTGKIFTTSQYIELWIP